MRKGQSKIIGENNETVTNLVCTRSNKWETSVKCVNCEMWKKTVYLCPIYNIIHK